MMSTNGSNTRTNPVLIGFLLLLLVMGLAGLIGMAFARNANGGEQRQNPPNQAAQPTATVTVPSSGQAITTPSATIPPSTPTSAGPARTPGISGTSAAPTAERTSTIAPTVAVSIPTSEPPTAPTEDPLLPDPTMEVVSQPTNVAVANSPTPQSEVLDNSGPGPQTQPTSRPQAPAATAPPNVPDPPNVPPQTGTERKTPTPKRIPTAKPTPAGPPLLPNGVRYGDRKPNLPNRIVRIKSTNVKLDTPVYEVYSPKGKWEVADYAGGHHYNSANPGEGGNIVVAGHNNWRGEVFRYLEYMKPGHIITVTTLDGKEHKYEVKEIKKLKEAGASQAQRIANGKVMNPTPHEQLTLITCWPYTTFTHRLIVIATPVE